ncbi:MAG: Type 1 glutamine amidotransferase-like domain-containing protein [Pirellula sp.]|nr:Type 1 glutamine amidotransferase-like domain-containing protein [Pirellula sp.]
MKSTLSVLPFFIFGILASGFAHGQTFDERFDIWPVDLKINGCVVAMHAEAISDKILESSLPKSPSQSILVLADQNEAAVQSTLQSILAKFSSSDIVSTSVIEEESSDALFAPWDTVVWSDSREVNKIPPALLKRFETLARAHIRHGKNIVVAGPHAKTLSKFYVESIDLGHPRIAMGMNLLPDVVLETNCEASNEGNPQVLSVLASQPRCVGIALEKNTALVLRGRKLRVWGEGTGTLMLHANGQQPIRLQTIAPESSEQRSPNRYLADLTEWRRDAIDRTLPPFPPKNPEAPIVENGTLLIVGGGGLPNGLMDRFCELAGGPDNAKLVYVPCEEADEVSPNQSILETWKKKGIQHATMLHTKDRKKANEDEEFLKPLREATGIWFGGGRQWNFADSYYGTAAHRLMKEVLQRGGVIGGSSAGASIQARYLARATPIENFNIMAPGYERGGLGFIDGVAIDQHFTQRGRQRDMTQLVNRYPQLLGIGIDETTAITVNGSKATVSGKGKVYFYDRRQAVYPDRPDYIALESGQSFDLVTRREIAPETSPTTGK